MLNAYVFGMEWSIRNCGLNAPGMMHDSTLANYGNIYEKLDKVFEETGDRIVKCLYVNNYRIIINRIKL